MLGELAGRSDLGNGTLSLLGMSHRSAPLAVRERFALDKDEIPELLERLRQRGAREALILNTCNRIELYASFGAAKNDAIALDDVLAAAAARQSGDAAARAALERHAYRREGAEAVLHLFRVASSLDSLVIGEDQILAQVKASYDLAFRTGSLGPRLHAAFQAAIKAGKRVRRETSIGASKLSVSSVAIDFVERVFADLAQKAVLLVGAGDAARLTLVHLRGRGVRSIRIANRSLENAARLAAELGGEAVPIDAVAAEVARADIVITSVGAPKPLVTARAVSSALRERRARPIFFLDIAVPRDVEPEVERLEGAFLYNLDDLQRVVKESHERRQEDVEAAGRIVTDEVQRFLGRERHRSLAPLVTLLIERAERTAKGEVEEILAKKPDLAPDARAELERLAERLVRRVLHEPLTAIRREARVRDDDALARLLERILDEARAIDSENPERD